MKTSLPYILISGLVLFGLFGCEDDPIEQVNETVVDEAFLLKGRERLSLSDSTQVEGGAAGGSWHEGSSSSNKCGDNNSLHHGQ